VGTEELTSVLDEAGASYELLPHAHTEAATAEADALGAPADDVAKTLVVTTPEGYVRAVVPASCRLDVSKLRELRGAGKKAAQHLRSVTRRGRTRADGDATCSAQASTCHELNSCSTGTRSAPGCGRGSGRVRSPSTPDGARISSWRSNSPLAQPLVNARTAPPRAPRGPIGSRSPGSCRLLAEPRQGPPARKASHALDSTAVALTHQ